MPRTTGNTPPPNRSANGVKSDTPMFRSSGGPIPVKIDRPAGKNAVANMGCSTTDIANNKPPENPREIVAAPVIPNAVAITATAPNLSINEPEKKTTNMPTMRETLTSVFAKGRLKFLSLIKYVGNIE